MFGWLNKNNVGAAGQEKLPGPKRMPDDVGRTLVVDHKLDFNWVWTLKVVVKPGEAKGNFLVRVFDERDVSSKKLQVRDYNSFNENPELILFDGWFNKKTHVAKIKSCQKAA
jgi:hypothetical protein